MNGSAIFPSWLSAVCQPLTVNLFPINRTISVSTQVQGGDFNLYEGMRCHGVPLVTISRGRLVCENGVFMCAEGSGKFYPQRTFPDFLYKKMVQREKVCLNIGVVFLSKGFTGNSLVSGKDTNAPLRCTVSS